jgi:hypothetical protein
MLAIAFGRIWLNPSYCRVIGLFLGTKTDVDRDKDN